MDKSFARSRYEELSKYGSSLNLSFSSYLVLSNKMVALDGIKKCLLILDTSAEEAEHLYYIDLNDVDTITLRKSYGSINKEELVHKDIQEFLERIELEFRFRAKNETITLSFYDGNVDARTDRPTLEKRAASWQKLLSKMLCSPAEKRNIIKKKTT
jgi:hypothetical protein